jgi:hypothetical protein
LGQIIQELYFGLIVLLERPYACCYKIVVDIIDAQTPEHIIVIINYSTVKFILEGRTAGSFRVDRKVQRSSVVL